MSKTKQNSLTKFYSGKFGKDFVLRNKDGNSTMAKLPKPSNKPATESQKDVKLNFRLAVNYAKKCVADPALNAYYSSKPEKGTSVYRLAMCDYLRVPVVEGIKTQKYQGAVGDKITVIAIDDFEVINVMLRITKPDGSLIEEGPCVPDSLNSVWDYTATVDVGDTTGLVVTAAAFDTPGNMGEKSITL